MDWASPADDLALLEMAARAAGLIALGYFRKDPKVWWKEGNSPVSEADYAVDRYLKETLLSARPRYGWLSEETDLALVSSAPAAEPDRFFVVDPIDGTRAYLRGEDTWCVSIAVVERGRPIAGVIDVPARGEVYSASAGGSALLNGEVSAVSRASGQALAVAMPDPLRRRLGKEAGVVFARNAPSLAYRLALVASGRLDGTLIRAHAQDWDIAAGDLILERAGGALVDAAGNRSLYKSEGKRHGLLVAAADHALQTLLGLALSSGASAAADKESPERRSTT